MRKSLLLLSLTIAIIELSLRLSFIPINRDFFLLVDNKLVSLISSPLFYNKILFIYSFRYPLFKYFIFNYFINIKLNIFFKFILTKFVKNNIF